MSTIPPTIALSATALQMGIGSQSNPRFCLPTVFQFHCMIIPHRQLSNLFNFKRVCDCPFEPPCAQEPECPVDETWTVCQQDNGKATIQLGDKYELILNEHSSRIIIRNKETCEETNIWGDPHIDWNKDGKTDADFWTKTTFELEDGTKITIDTEKWKGNEDMYVANDITITKDDKVIQITGLSQNELGDMQINQSDCGGQIMDWLVTDGFVVEENPCGEGWINPETGEMATQDDFNITKPGAEKPYEFNQAFGQMLGLFLFTGLINWSWDR
jgi:hypothetical protein